MMPEENKKVTDLRYLKGLAEGNKEFIESMITAFLTENPNEISEVEKGISEQDYSLIRSGAHRMRSTIPFVGIDSIIGDAVSEIEELAKMKQNLLRIKTLFARVKEICSQASAELVSL
ncbi:MAG: hypothetical protein ACJ77K_08965 [Bacteroidia bacterium]